MNRGQFCFYETTDFSELTRQFSACVYPARSRRAAPMLPVGPISQAAEAYLRRELETGVTVKSVPTCSKRPG